MDSCKESGEGGINSSTHVGYLNKILSTIRNGVYERIRNIRTGGVWVDPKA
jgi:hypothetical protein